MIYKVGDRVRIKYNFFEIRKRYDPNIVPDMIALEGTESYIDHVYDGGRENPEEFIYHLNNISWSWIGDWLEPIEEYGAIKDVSETEVFALFEE